MDTIKNYLDNMFARLPDTEEVRAAKEELAQMMEDKYSEMLDAGHTENEAVGAVIADFGNLDEIAESLGIMINEPKDNNANEEQQKDNDNSNLHASQTGNPDAPIAYYVKAKKEKDIKYYYNKPLAHFMSGYRSIVLCVYLIWSFITFDWHITWVVWVIGAIVCALIEHVCAIDMEQDAYSRLECLSRRRVVKVYTGILTAVTVIIIVLTSLFRCTPLSSTIADAESITFGHTLKDSFTQVEVSDLIGDVTFVTDEKAGITYNGMEQYQPTYTIEDGVLKVEPKDDSFFFGIHFGDEQTPSSTTITIPTDITLEKLSLDCDYGDITVDAVKSAKSTFSIDVGDLQIETDADLGETTIECDTGNILLDSAKFTSLDVESDIGNITLNGLGNLNSYTMDLSCDLGEITLGDENFEHAYKQPGSGDCTIKANTDTGNIELSSN
ncbi:permease prefix domain 1-containing protein [Eubacterium oxidoreducens]|uniref:Putative adhesin n=1 Tax=Eubacterium oxidoreducens TaxID=1732 RepID=A0A1G6AA87_EUBOX|nr:DUF4097 family beta strand repeat-containing protein [Eubacterium oxidoreducens]SDB05309.1 Putative adhesin [Eubacterium oxidoreducens]